jgi:hypothetical protein
MVLCTLPALGLPVYAGTQPPGPAALPRPLPQHLSLPLHIGAQSSGRAQALPSGGEAVAVAPARLDPRCEALLFVISAAACELCGDSLASAPHLRLSVSTQGMGPAPGPHTRALLTASGQHQQGRWSGATAAVASLCCAAHALCCPRTR